MPTRRTLLSQIAGITLAGAFVSAGSTATGRTSAENTPQPIQRDSTELTVSGDPNIVGQIGFPPVEKASLGSIGRYTGIVSADDVAHLFGTSEISDGHFTSGSGTAVGSFDVRSIATDLQRHTAFSRIDRPTGSNASKPERVSGSRVTTTASQGDRHRGMDKYPSAIMTRPEPASVVVLEPARIDVAVDGTRTAVVERLATQRRRTVMVGESTPGKGDFTSDQDSDAMAHVSLGESMRRRLLDMLPAAAERLDRIVRVIQEGGVVIEEGTDTTEVRYSFSFEADYQAKEAFTALLADLRTHERVRLVDQSVSSSARSVHVSLPTDSLWTLHGDLLDV